MMRNKGIPRDKLPFRRRRKRDDESMNDKSGAEAREARAAGREARSREAEAREAEAREAQAREARAAAREARAREAQAREAQAREAQAREAQAREAHARETQAREQVGTEAEGCEQEGTEAEDCEQEGTEAENHDARAREARLREAAARAEACRVEEELSEDDCAVGNDDDLDGIENDVDEEDEDETNSNQAEDEEDEEEEVDEANVDEDVARDEKNESDADSGDDIWDDEKIPDPLSSDDEDDEEEQIRRDHQDEDELLALGKCFNSAEDFKLAVLRYSLKTRYDVKLYRSQARKIGAKCSDTEGSCGWRIYCSYEKRKQKMQVKVYINEHTCVRSGYSKMLKRSTIAWLFAERLRLNPKLTKQEMVSEILREYNLVVSDEQCGKAKTKILRERKQSHETHFARIWDYRAEVLRTNKGTKFEIETIPGPTIGSPQRFYRLFICFNSQRESWKQTCRPIIGLDGAFLRWDIKGHLLAAVGRDGDNRIVPIAWAVVEIENDDNWDWFVKQLSETLGLDDGRNVAIISDKQKGLVKAIHNVLPSAEHRQCCKHIIDNWKKDNHDVELKRMFWRIARSYTRGEYAANLEVLKLYNPNAHTSLLKTNPPSWSRAFFRTGYYCNDNLNNLSESFNRTIRQARRKPILDMLEEIRRQCMVRNAKRAIIAGRLKTTFTKRAHDEIEKMIRGTKYCIRHMARDNFHEVEVNNISYSVDMNNWSCGCRKWEMVGIPCIHAAAVIIGRKERVGDYVSDYYKAKTWRDTYNKGIRPVQGMLLWPRLNRLPVLPPPWRKGDPGRPSNYARKKGRYETATSSSKTRLSRAFRVITCSNCKEEGHNKQKCPNEKVPDEPKRPRGRPRKNQGALTLSQAQGSQGLTQVEGSQVLG